MFDGRDPIYLQIADQIRNDILSGTLAAEEQIMSTTQYATTYRINPATAARAFSELVDEGIIYKKRGIGMFVTPDAQQKLLVGSRKSFFADTLEPLVEQARIIGIPLSEIIAYLQQSGEPEEGK